jgi:two-component sensor histidine kinase
VRPVASAGDGQDDDEACGAPPDAALAVLVRWAPPALPSCVPRVRHGVRDVLLAWHAAPDVVDTLLLVVSELVANSVRHASEVTSRVGVTVALGPTGIRLDVTDDDPCRPRARADSGDEAEDGRGLLIVKLTVAEMDGVIDVLPHGPGKTIRVRVPVHPDTKPDDAGPPDL